MLDVFLTTQFKKDYKKIKRTKDTALLFEVVDMLRNGKGLPEKYRDHRLSDSKDYKGMRECHIAPDWLLVYRIDNLKLVLVLARTGSHSELFG